VKLLNLFVIWLRGRHREADGPRITQRAQFTQADRAPRSSLRALAEADFGPDGVDRI
jgi:hypothetical protein